MIQVEIIYDDEKSIKIIFDGLHAATGSIIDELSDGTEHVKQIIVNPNASMEDFQGAVTDG